MGVDPYITLEIIKYMESYAIGNLIYGETVDVQMGMTSSKDTMKFTQDDVIDMLLGKNWSVIWFFCTSRAMIGKGTSQINDPQVTAVKDFAPTAELHSSFRMIY